MGDAYQVLIVEDEILIALALKMELTRAGYSVCGIATRGEEAVQLTFDLLPDVILMDIRLAGEMDGFAVAERIRLKMQTPIIFITGYADDANMARADRFPITTILSKPVSFGKLRSVLEQGLQL